MVGMRRGQYSSCPMIFEDEGYRSPSSRRPLLCVLKKPRAWKPPAIHVHVFQTFLRSEQWVVNFEFILNLCSFVKNTHNSLLIAHCSKASGRREARWANSRGFLNPWNNWQDKEIASGRRGTATVFNVERWTNVVWKIHVAVPRLCRRPLLCVLKKPRAWKPPAIHVHVFQTFLSSEMWVVSFELLLNLCSFVKKLTTHRSLLIAQRLKGVWKTRSP